MSRRKRQGPVHRNWEGGTRHPREQRAKSRPKARLVLDAIDTEAIPSFTAFRRRRQLDSVILIRSWADPTSPLSSRSLAIARRVRQHLRRSSGGDRDPPLEPCR